MFLWILPIIFGLPFPLAPDFSDTHCKRREQKLTGSCDYISLKGCQGLYFSAVSKHGESTRKSCMCADRSLFCVGRWYLWRKPVFKGGVKLHVHGDASDM